MTFWVTPHPPPCFELVKQLWPLGPRFEYRGRAEVQSGGGWGPRPLAEQELDFIKKIIYAFLC